MSQYLLSKALIQIAGPVRIGMLPFSGLEIELAPFDRSLSFLSPVYCLFFTLKTFRDGGVTFDADDSAPCFGAVFIFSFVNRCHNLQPWCFRFRLEAGKCARFFSLHRHCTGSLFLRNQLWGKAFTKLIKLLGES